MTLAARVTLSRCGLGRPGATPGRQTDGFSTYRPDRAVDVERQRRGGTGRLSALAELRDAGRVLVVDGWGHFTRPGAGAPFLAAEGHQVAGHADDAPVGLAAGGHAGAAPGCCRRRWLRACPAGARTCAVESVEPSSHGAASDALSGCVIGSTAGLPMRGRCQLAPRRRRACSQALSSGWHPGEPAHRRLPGASREIDDAVPEGELTRPGIRRPLDDPLSLK